ncbi:MAG TPA: NADP-dependent oxidoreductase [Bryobacteraceae bacterium]|nr:NADP-dependent oxidoreductase [Bryobacteraceae bacterium]HPQ16734.1 NADP-dependent oxidoreductase [Bryobacteraceae bacterium]HPU72744.1 NADP-dependent oxidoreductase [Bryobacteraceae bacterium]
MRQTTMRAAAIDRFGGPEVLRIHSVPVPEPAEGEVLIALDTAGVGSWDAAMRAGWSPTGHTEFPLVLGSDGAGTVAAVGPGVERLREGDQVYAYGFANPKGGFYAEYVVVKEEQAAPIPKNLDLLRAGAIPTTGLTALQGLDDALRIQPGETVLIHGAGGGVGSLAVQFAKLRGARVIATATGEDGVEFVRRLGADEALDGRREDLAAEIRRVAPGGVSNLLALAGGAGLERCLDAMRDGGRLAYPNGVEPEPKPRQGLRVTTYNGEPGVEQFSRLTRAVEEAGLQVPIAAEYPLGDAAKAHERLAAGHVLGKIVLRTRA